MKKIYLFFAALAIAASASAALDVPASLTGEVQVIMEDGVAFCSTAAGFSTNVGGWADLGSGDCVIPAGGTKRLNGTAADLNTSFGYCVIKARIAPGAIVSDVTIMLGIALEVLSTNKNVWGLWGDNSKKVWTDGTNDVAPITTEWAHYIFAVDYTGNGEPAWTRIAFESWVNGKIQIEDIWYSQNKPNFNVVITVDKTALQTAITAVNALVEANYTPASWAVLKTALTAANTVNNNSSATQTEVDAATTILNAAINALETVSIVVNKEALQASIAAAEALSSTGYTTESWNTMQAALVAAKSVNSNSSATQTEVDAATTVLNAAITALQTVGIYDLAADGAVAVGFYSILGAKLSEEPVSGVFIVKYSNGKAVKVVK